MQTAWNGEESESNLHFNSKIFEFVDETKQKYPLFQFCHWLGFVKVIFFSFFNKHESKMFEKPKTLYTFSFSLHYKCRESGLYQKTVVYVK